ncbi:2-hydroxy-6-ketonona-2,4-dienedioic acid hydrolase [Intrasporangium oryzae NRRL B-24470]|uniref:2-hydroxy-6-ketonona-2,4-dienedioic acid hydrolase n=1 Tax=Intrasporangium oryzae NRRL B-24470 TaxID=1386089 RepID=W9G9N0_9MICO|nr:alpha/beta hydrolase [Intrasporangium oryzae]EWT01952.1 2-hydroxy-6-ketonona-2,4-dienedioic acid hydrolase [Intrasporangium oryzae NRRL B-24470]
MEVLERVPRTESVVDVGHRKLFVTEAGNGNPVVLLHGGGPGATGVSNYSRNIDALADQFRVIVPDMPGYGRSSKDIDHSDPFGDLACAVRGLLDELGVEKAHLVGNSYGGAAALRLALDRPDKVDRLILMGPGGVGTTRALPTKGLKTLFRYYGGKGPSRDKLATFIREYLVYDGAAVPDELIDVRYDASIHPEVVADPPLRRPFPAAPRTLLRMDFTRDRRLAHQRTPTLVIWGADDKVNRPAGGLSLARTMPNCDLYLAARTGHWVQWERPDLFNSLALDFLGAKETSR